MRERRVAAVRAVEGRAVVVTWPDGVDHTIDVSVHAPVDEALFRQPAVAEEGGAVAWPDGSALSAAVLWDMALAQDGARLVRWRTARGLTQGGFAEAVGIGLAAVRRYESGVSPIPKTVKLALIGHDALERMAKKRASATPPDQHG